MSCLPGFSVPDVTVGTDLFTNTCRFITRSPTEADVEGQTAIPTTVSIHIFTC